MRRSVTTWPSCSTRISTTVGCWATAGDVEFKMQNVKGKHHAIRIRQVRAVSPFTPAAANSSPLAFVHLCMLHVALQVIKTCV